MRNCYIEAFGLLSDLLKIVYLYNYRFCLCYSLFLATLVQIIHPVMFCVPFARICSLQHSLMLKSSLHGIIFQMSVYLLLFINVSPHICKYRLTYINITYLQVLAQTAPRTFIRAQRKIICGTSVKINEYGCRDAPCEKSWKQGKSP